MLRSEDPLSGLGYAPVSSALPFTRLGEETTTNGSAIVAEEVPIALVYNGRSHVVVMGTPADLEDLAIGFSLTESIVPDARDIERIDVVNASHGIELQLQIAPAAAEALDQRARGLVARTGCGLCGVETIREAMRMPPAVSDALRVDEEALWRAASSLSGQQRVNNDTNAVHAAGWATTDGVLAVTREDVGRHNALDKLLGALAREGRDASHGFVVITSRASYEMVQKSASRGIELLAAISRPTALAVRFAEASGVTLIGLLRGRSGNVYTGTHRLTPSSATRGRRS